MKINMTFRRLLYEHRNFLIIYITPFVILPLPLLVTDQVRRLRHFHEHLLQTRATIRAAERNMRLHVAADGSVLVHGMSAAGRDRSHSGLPRSHVRSADDRAGLRELLEG